MKAFFKQFSGPLGAGIAAACCLGMPAIIAAFGAVGLGFLVHDAYLFPLFAGFAGVSVWLLYHSAKRHGQMGPFWLSLAGAVLGTAGLWLMVTGLLPQPWSVTAGLAVLVVGSVWDYINGRRAPSCEVACEVPADEVQAGPDLQRRAITGAGISLAAAGAFYGLYKSVDVLVPQAEQGAVACWGINECKGESACSTALNYCTGQNECKGQGYIFVPEKQCYAQGGELLVGSVGDPANR